MRSRVLVFVALLALGLGVVAAGAGAQEGTAAEGTDVAEVTAAHASAAPNSVSAFGDARHLGDPSGLALNQPLVGIGATPTGDGYWLVAGDGGIFSYGDARFRGSMGGVQLDQPVVGIASTASGDGYWQVAGDGGIFSFGDARFHGSMGGIPLDQPVVGMAATPSGGGYWLVASDGGIFSFGDARFHGSMGGIPLDQPVVGMAATPSGGGYWLAAADGGIFSFGDARFLGAATGESPDQPIVGIARAGEVGYWMVSRAGQIFPFGPADYGSVESYADDLSKAPTVGIASHGNSGYWFAHGGERSLSDIRDRGEQVRQAQQRLRALRYWVGPVDGVFGTLTEQAVYAFQKYEGLPVTGELDDRTLDLLSVAGRPLSFTTSGDIIEIDKRRQLLFFVRGGQVAWVFNTSTGKEEPYTFEGEQYFSDTPNGRHEIIREIDGVRVAPLGRLYRPKYFTTNGHAIHGYTHVPPEPASHGCVRVTNPAMDFIWSQNLSPIGMDVWVFGTIPS